MDTKTVIKQVAISLFARRKKWVVLTTLAALVLLGPAAYVLSKEPPRYRTTATILIETKSDRAPVFQEFSPFAAVVGAAGDSSEPASRRFGGRGAAQGCRR